jgi:RND superfamily putative drug exporter
MPRVEASLTGTAAIWAGFNEANREAMLKSALISWPVTLAILVLAFGSRVAAGLRAYVRTGARDRLRAVRRHALPRCARGRAHRSSPLVSISAVLLVPSPAFRSVSLGIMVSVLFVLAATPTLLPAALAKLGALLATSASSTATSELDS